MAPRIPVGKVAIVIIDVQNDFCAPEGPIRKYADDNTAFDSAVAGIGRLVSRAREFGVACIFVRSFMDEKYKLPALQRKQKRLGFTQSICVEGSWGAEFYEVKPKSGEPVVTKHTADAFLYTYLEPLLRKLGATNVVLAGVLTEVCVAESAQSAFQRGFHVVLVRDCTAGLSRECARVAVENIGALQAEIVDCDDLVSMWQTQARRRRESRRQNPQISLPLEGASNGSPARENHVGR